MCHFKPWPQTQQPSHHGVHHFPAFIDVIKNIYYILTTFTNTPFRTAGRSLKAALNAMRVMPFSNTWIGNKLLLLFY